LAGKRKVPLTIITLALLSEERDCAGGICIASLSLPAGIEFISQGSSPKGIVS
jgi:hypothetical protein